MTIAASLAASFARRLEDGTLVRGAIARGLSAFYGGVANVARPLVWPARVRVIAVGGATLGGSGKTPVAIAIAREAARSHHRVALIGHAYRARPRTARVVVDRDQVGEVGDEAIVCARALASTAAEVIVAPRRQEAVDFAVARGASLLVVDGMLQASPRRVDRALLVVDGDAPWGAGAPPPLGDLRASRARLLAACDEVLEVGEHCVVSAGARVGPAGGSAELVRWGELARMKLGLVTSTARPERLARFLARRGIFPVIRVHAADHARAALPSRAANVDAWLCTEKCSVHMKPTSREAPSAASRDELGAVPLAVIEYAVDLHAAAAAPPHPIATRRGRLVPAGAGLP